MTALYYTYRNLNQGRAFSTKHRGIVQSVSAAPAIIFDGRFRVNPGGRENVIKYNKRNVHAFVTSEELPVTGEPMPAIETLSEVKYNPYKANHFMDVGRGREIFQADRVYLINGRCYVD